MMFDLIELAWMVAQLVFWLALVGMIVALCILALLGPPAALCLVFSRRFRQWWIT